MNLKKWTLTTISRTPLPGGNPIKISSLKYNYTYTFLDSALHQFTSIKLVIWSDISLESCYMYYFTDFMKLKKKGCT